jgi:hypothetical protein
MAERAADDFATIREAINTLRRQEGAALGCQIRAGGKATDCWCYRRSVEGNTLQCPPPSP